MEYGAVADAWGVADLRGEYDILGEIGRGGSAVVYRARDRELGREVAVKVVHPRPTSPDDDPVARLAREARTAAQLQHPNIVAVYAVRRLRGGGLALVMQLVPGDTLKTLVQREGPLAPAHCERLLHDVATALTYAHARGVVHRDVKPENIFLDEETGHAMLADFGIARSAEADSMTMTGTAVGTPFYMSPEQVDGGAVDGRSDLYSLGLVAWEMLTGCRPWDGESLYNVIYKQKHEHLPPIEALRPGVPLRLQYVVERTLQKRPAARWAGAEGLLAQLGHSVLPGDYAQWQRSLRARVARHRKDEERRAAEQPAVATVPACTSATLHFPRASPQAPSGILAHTLTFPMAAAGPSAERALPPERAESEAPGVAVLPLPGVTVDLHAPDLRNAPASASAPVYLDTVEPSWPSEEESRSTPVRPDLRSRSRLLAGAAVLAMSISVGVGALNYQDLSATVTGIAAGHSAGTSASASGSARAALGFGARTTDGASPRGDALGNRIGSARIATYRVEGAPVLAAGGRHTCTLGPAGTLYCWGANDRGQLGDGTTAAHFIPAAVAGAFTFTSVTGGWAHSCATTRLGDVYCWGADGSGQLGDATTVRRNAPVRVAGAGVYSSVATGAAHSCAITTDGALRCWGANDHGQLGDGTRTDRAAPNPVQLPGPAAHVAVGGQHTCAALADGRLFCWGANAQGQLGDGAHNSLHTPALAVVLPRPVTAVSAGLSHTCALTDDGGGWCWGHNESGQLGSGTRINRATPTPIHTAPGRALMVIANGAAHTCALDDTGSVWCWGRNGRGAVGDGTTMDRLHPVRVRMSTAATAIASGIAHSCAATTNGNILCWGDNSNGQLGDGSRSNRRSPTLVRQPGGAVLLKP